MNHNISTINQPSDRAASETNQVFVGFTNNLADWLGLSLRTQLEHDMVVLKIPGGAMRWPATLYKEENCQLNSGTLKVDVSGLSLIVSFTLSHMTNLTDIRKQEQFTSGEDPHTDVVVEGVVLTPSDLRGLFVWLVQTLRPTEFVVHSA